MAWLLDTYSMMVGKHALGVVTGILSARSLTRVLGWPTDVDPMMAFAAFAGATLSGSGPSVVVWATDAEECAAELRERFPDERVLRLGVSSFGALG